MARDVVVIGATISGLTAARRLASEGFDVAVLDPNPEYVSADVGHGVAGIAHTSAIANMRAAYGDQAVVDHVRRTVAGVQEIHHIAAAGSVPVTTTQVHDHSLGFALERALRELMELLRRGGAEAELLPPRERRRAEAGLGSGVLLLDPHDYAVALTDQARTAGATVMHDVTVIRLNRNEGHSGIAYRDNLDWTSRPGREQAAAVVDTMGVSPWGTLARVGPELVAPTLRCRPLESETVVTLLGGPPVWMMRPVGDEMLLVGTKTRPENLDAAADQLAAWAARTLLAEDLHRGRLVIDPSDHGCPVAGASGTPGGYYTRGNGRAEMVNGTASGLWLSAMLTGGGAEEKRVALPRLSRIRAHIRGGLRR